MKQLFFALIFTIFSFAASAVPKTGSASSTSGGGMGVGTTFGVIGGYRYNSMVVPTDNYYQRTLRATSSYQAGLILLIPIAESTSLRFGGLYAVRDMDFTTNAGLLGRARLGFIELPAALQIKLFSSSFYIWFGQMTGIKVTDTCDLDGITNSCTMLAAPVDISSVWGLGWNVFDIGEYGKFSIEIEYEYGMNNIFPAFQTNTTALIANGIIRFGI